jgi:hypothetical protein
VISDRFSSCRAARCVSRWAANTARSRAPSRSDPYLKAGLLLNTAAVAPTGGGFDVKEGFAEISLPLLRDRP